MGEGEGVNHSPESLETVQGAATTEQEEEERKEEVEYASQCLQMFCMFCFEYSFFTFPNQIKLYILTRNLPLS